MGNANGYADFHCAAVHRATAGRTQFQERLPSALFFPDLNGEAYHGSGQYRDRFHVGMAYGKRYCRDLIEQDLSARDRRAPRGFASNELHQLAHFSTHCAEHHLFLGLRPDKPSETLHNDGKAKQHGKHCRADQNAHNGGFYVYGAQRGLFAGIGLFAALALNLRFVRHVDFVLLFMIGTASCCHHAHQKLQRRFQANHPLGQAPRFSPVDL
ncbi:hypothetical protein [Burkholderia pseudomallei]|uniref:hypothetical protein n=1 Tax=Burkholderia pseudomallei TaxID=28450 RepID=UPI0012B98878